MSNRRRLGKPRGSARGCPACGGPRQVIRWRGENRVTYVHQPGCTGVSGVKVRSA